ncbi:hypothetical protein Pla22_01020 [Rubripirellula amarantea]|uniref:Transmembrane protein n=1 Tax=Rubripirellula amarantea TaxID=2527999 RepID=A0A5C5WP99_9BACT|nr:hypothetical protein [Rubripirellula amarantea]TWT52478.1 hypothetical protein Pla22_01020 [Rubripirellula amarantea]
MRIPSQLNDDNLYRRGTKRPRPVDAYRRIVRMCLALVLVFVVMNAASREAIYRPFFGSPDKSGFEPNQETLRRFDQTSVLGEDAASGKGVAAQRDKQVGASKRDREMADAITGQMSPKDQVVWGIWLTGLQKGQTDSQPPLASISLADALASFDQVVASTSSVQDDSDNDADDANDEGKTTARWQQTIGRIGGENALSAFAADDLTRLDVLREAIADAAQQRVVDGSVWRSSDRDAIRLRLAQWKRNQPLRGGQSAVSVGVLPLLQQPVVFLGRVVVVSGRVARSERIVASDGLPEYWQLWIRPDDGADRPIVAIVGDVPADIARISSDAILEAGPAVSIQGHFLKRLAYRSTLGADLAPVIVGRLPVHVTNVDDELVGRSSTQPSSVSAGLVLAIAFAVGVILAGVIMWRTHVLAVRTRSLRNRHRVSPVDLSSMETNES